jgi:hypothetical protein
MQLIYPHKNVFKTVILTVISILICFSLFLQGLAIPNSVDLEWKVSIGDSKTYFISNLYEKADYDGNGNPSTVLANVIDTNNNSVKVVLMKGSTITVEVIDLNESALIQISYNNNVTIKPHLDDGNFLQKATIDRSYWEQVAKENTGCSVSGELFTLKQTSSGVDSIKKYNMTSGWLEYSHKSYDDNVEEFSALDYQAKQVSFDLVFSFLGILILVAIARNKEKFT